MALEAYLSMIIVAMCIIYGINGGGEQVEGRGFQAMFVFGDSLVDNGNNNFLDFALAKSNYFPYGIDFPGGPTGRFSNGFTIIDFLGELLGLPLLPSFGSTLSASIDEIDILSGVNYASAAAGILEESGKNLGDRIKLRQQVQNFETTINQIKNLRTMDATKLGQYLEKALVVVNIGNNDYLNNYLMPLIYTTSSTYNPTQYADLLINQFTTHLLELHNLGLRKFMVAAVGPLGCTPHQLATKIHPRGECVSFDNNIVQIFNNKLRSLVIQLNANHSSDGSIFLFGNTYGVFTDILNNSNDYGFSVTDRGCCGIGRNKGQITCLPLAFPCFNRNRHVFWDAYHPTQAFNQIIAQRAYGGTQSDCYPINIKQLAAQL
ncbi:hypothetical protein ACFE04_029079 [Oxalis oulophora]